MARFNAKAVLLEKLRLVRDQPKKPDKSICGMLDEHVWEGNGCNYIEAQSVDSALRKLFQQWPEYSGEIWYPVPSPMKGEDPSRMFSRCKNMWGRSKYGDKRRELLNWLIAELEK